MSQKGECQRRIVALRSTKNSSNDKFSKYNEEEEEEKRKSSRKCGNCSPPLLLALGLLCLASHFPTAEAMPPLQLLRMYSSPSGANPALEQFVANAGQGRPHALLSRKLRELSNAYLAEEAARIHGFGGRSEEAVPSNGMEKRANEFEVEPDEEKEDFGGRGLLLKQKEQLPAEMDDEDSAVLAAAAGLLRQERNEPNAAVPKMYARHIGDLGGTMFRFG